MQYLIKRKILTDLQSHLFDKDISLIIGPRQAGKTTLMLLLKEYLEKLGEKTLFLNLDFELDRPFFTSQSTLIKKLELEFGKRKGYVFIDEIQRKENAGIFLKGIYDSTLPHKLIVSGSGSVELKEKIHESLTGRKRVFELNTVSFEEFINFKTEYRYTDRLKDFLSIESAKAKELLIEYLNFGGYPRVILTDTFQEKIRLIDEIFNSYIEKDISYLLNVEKTDAFRNLIKLIADQIGNMVNITEISSTLGLSIQTVKNYLTYAERTFIIKKITPFFSNIRKEISKSPIYYFNDLGLRNYSIGLFGRLSLPSDMSFLFQNFIFHILKEKYRYEAVSIHYWRTKDKAEVDFVISIGRNIIPVEVKYKELKDIKLGRSLRNFINKYKPKEAWIINLTLNKQLIIDQTIVKFIPFFEFI